MCIEIEQVTQALQKNNEIRDKNLKKHLSALPQVQFKKWLYGNIIVIIISAVGIISWTLRLENMVLNNTKDIAKIQTTETPQTQLLEQRIGVCEKTQIEHKTDTDKKFESIDKKLDILIGFRK